MTYYAYDGTFNGLLTAIFELYDRKDVDVRLMKAGGSRPVFENMHTVITVETKAMRVWKGLQKHLDSKTTRLLFVAFLSENDAVVESVFYIIDKIFRNHADILHNYGDSRIMSFHQAVKSVEREKHRMKAFIRFQKGADGLYATMVQPDFNVLPLIVTFFKNRYADQRWLIYDQRRHYGYYYNLQSVEEVAILPANNHDVSTGDIAIDTEDAKYQELWKAYFKSTNIESRRNMKLHLQHVPRRYWRYLTEKAL